MRQFLPGDRGGVAGGAKGGWGRSRRAEIGGGCHE